MLDKNDIVQYECIQDKGPLRKFERTAYPRLITYSCPNNIHVLLTKDKNYEFLKRSGLVRKNEPFLRVSGEEVSLPFSFKFVEACDDTPYLAIITRLKDRKH